MGSCLVRLSFDFDFVAGFFWPPFWVWEPFVKHWHLTFVGVFDFGEKVWCRLTEIYIFLKHCCRLLCNFCYAPAELEPTSIWLGAQLWEYPKFLWCQLCGHLKKKQVMYIENYCFLICTFWRRFCLFRHFDNRWRCKRFIAKVNNWCLFSSNQLKVGNSLSNPWNFFIIFSIFCTTI